MTRNDGGRPDVVGVPADRSRGENDQCPCARKMPWNGVSRAEHSSRALTTGPAANLAFVVATRPTTRCTAQVLGGVTRPTEERSRCRLRRNTDPSTHHVPTPSSRVDPPKAHAPGAFRQRCITGVILAAPFVAVTLLALGVVDDGLVWWNIAIAVGFYVVVALGVTVGYHRMLTHRSFEACRPLKIALAVAGSLSFQGSVIGWVAEHRRHHMFTDRPGDPHSPVRPASQPHGRARGFFHAHAGWFFAPTDTSAERFAPDLLADRDIVAVDRLFVPLCVATLALPFALGYALTGRIGPAIAALLLAGVVRIGLLHHVTWCTNSVCHMFGARPFRTADASTELRAAGPALDGRVVAQRPPRVPGARAAWRRWSPARRLRHDDPVVRAAGLGDAGALARPQSSRGPAPLRRWNQHGSASRGRPPR